MNISKPKILLDDSVKDVELFKSKEIFEICKAEIFKYGIMMEEVPRHIREADFDYLQSKIPAYEMLHSDFINVYESRIENLSNDDRKKKMISEIIGVAFGIKYSTELLDTTPSKFKKIGVPTEGKYLDYSIVEKNKEYELETKGTVAQYYSNFKNDIIKKKSNENLKDVYLRFGTIAMINNYGDTKETKCVVVDDPPNEQFITDSDDSFETQLLNYGIFLSYILDSKYYNKYIRPLRKKQIKKVKINIKKFFTTYTFKGKEYYGECFDYRLIREDLETLKYSDRVNNLLKAKTEKFGKTKFFIGLNIEVIDAINEKNIDFLNSFQAKWTFEESINSSNFLDKDGILIIKSIDGADQQLENIFTDDEVAYRLGASYNQQLGITHQCGAPCRSKEILGKPCKIRTYRKYCHFHR